MLVCWLGAEDVCPWYVGLVQRMSVLGMLAWCRGCLSVLGAEGFCLVLGAEGFCPWYVGLVLRVSVLGMLAWC